MRPVMTVARWGTCCALAGLLSISSIPAAAPLPSDPPLPSTPQLPDDPLPPDLLKASQEYDQAQLTNDGPALMRLLRDNLVLISGSGRTQSKTQFIRDSTAPGFKIEPFTIRESVHKLMGNTAILGGVVLLKGTSDNKPFTQRMRFSDVWQKRNGHWQVVYIQVTRLPND